LISLTFYFSGVSDILFCVVIFYM